MIQEDKPWWQLTKTPRQGFWLGGLNLLLTTLAWLRVTVAEDPVLAVFVAALVSLSAAAYFASSVALQRRNR